MITPTLDELSAFFDRFRRETCDGVEGVVCYEANESGPVLGISACTHGNEPAGLAALKHLLDHDIGIRLRRGTLFLVVNNLLAVERYFATLGIEEGEEKVTAKWKARFVDRNMNRLPKDTPTSADASYEVRRARELMPVWERFTVGFDIQSTAKDSPPMLINSRGVFQRELVRGFPSAFDIVVSNIDAAQIGAPAVRFYGDANVDIPVFLIEAGPHEERTSFHRATECAVALLGNLNMIARNARTTIWEYTEYVIKASVVFPDDSYELTRVLPDFEFVPKGTVLARGDGPDITMPFDGHAVFCKQRRKPDTLADEVLFLSLPARILRV